MQAIVLIAASLLAPTQCKPDCYPLGKWTVATVGGCSQGVATLTSQSLPWSGHYNSRLWTGAYCWDTTNNEFQLNLRRRDRESGEVHQWIFQVVSATQDKIVLRVPGSCTRVVMRRCR